MFESLEKLQPDPILGLIAAFRNDPRAVKVDLGAGVYRDEAGATPVLASVKAAERILLDTQKSKTYTGSEGDSRFNEQMQGLLLGAGHPAADRSWTIQTPGGSGALRVACNTGCQADRNRCKAAREPLSTSICARSTLATR